MCESCQIILNMECQHALLTAVWGAVEAAANVQAAAGRQVVGTVVAPPDDPPNASEAPRQRQSYQGCSNSCCFAYLVIVIGVPSHLTLLFGWKMRLLGKIQFINDATTIAYGCDEESPSQL